jgi:hypothetical protein
MDMSDAEILNAGSGARGDEDSGWVTQDPSERLLSILHLPLFDDLFLGMQARNIAAVDAHLRAMEREAHAEYLRTDRLPLPQVMLVSAISQMWVFAAYELLRTWRQWVTELLRYFTELEQATSSEARAATFQRRNTTRKDRKSGSVDASSFEDSFERIETDSAFAASLREARDTIESAYRRFESLRVTLAKHEVPKGRGVRAFAPGYARMDMMTGGLYWIVEDKAGNSDLIRRHELAEELASAAETYLTHTSEET